MKKLIIVLLIAAALAVLYSRFFASRWKFIVIHHSATSGGNLAAFHKYHTQTRGWPDVAYHIVINNGTSGTEDGQVEESNLWKNQRPNYSTQNAFVNAKSIAIALVGDFSRTRPTQKQLNSLAALAAKYMVEFDIDLDNVLPHRDINQTSCPGKNFDMTAFRQILRARLRELTGSD